MAEIRLREFDDEIHRQLKIMAINQGVSFQDLCKRILEDAVRED